MRRSFRELLVYTRKKYAFQRVYPYMRWTERFQCRSVPRNSTCVGVYFTNSCRILNPICFCFEVFKVRGYFCIYNVWFENDVKWDCIVLFFCDSFFEVISILCLFGTRERTGEDIERFFHVRQPSSGAWM